MEIHYFILETPERFDRALVRPGRIDMIIEFKKCNRNVLREMICGFYNITNVMQDDLWNHDEVDYRWTPAEVQQILFRNFDNPTAAMTELLETQPQKLEQTESMPLLEVPQELPEQLTTLKSLPVLETE